MTQKYYANYYSGANVSIFIGNSLLTQAAGIRWSTLDSKVPIYGYNSRYYDAVAHGQSITEGQIFINYTYDSYLAVTLQNFCNLRALVKRASDEGIDLVDAVQSDRLREMLLYLESMNDPTIRRRNRGRTRRPIADLEERTPFQTVGSIGQLETESPGPFSRNYPMDNALNEIFNNDQLRNDLINVFSGGLVESRASFVNPNSIESRISTSSPRSLVERTMSLNEASQEAARWAHITQFGSAVDGIDGINILLQFGPPHGDQVTNAGYNYSKNSGKIFKGVHFTSTAGSVNADNTPIVEVYNFIARKEESVPRFISTPGAQLWQGDEE